MRDAKGAVYRINSEDESIDIIQPAPGEVLPAEDRRRVGKGDGAEYRVLLRKLDTSVPVPVAEGQAIERTLAGAGAGITPKPPKYTVEAGRTGTVISYPEVPQKRLELFSALRERIREARARKEDRAGMADGAAEVEGAAAPAARERRAEAPARPAVTPPARAARGTTAARAAAATPGGVGPGARRASAPEPPLPSFEDEDFTRPTESQREETRRAALKGYGGAGPAQITSTISFSNPQIEAAEVETATPTTAPTAETKRKLGLFNKFRKAARAGNGG
jgi:hypothetical protein